MSPHFTMILHLNYRWLIFLTTTLDFTSFHNSIDGGRHRFRFHIFFVIAYYKVGRLHHCYLLESTLLLLYIKFRSCCIITNILSMLVFQHVSIWPLFRDFLFFSNACMYFHCYTYFSQYCRFTHYFFRIIISVHTLSLRWLF